MKNVDSLKRKEFNMTELETRILKSFQKFEGVDASNYMVCLGDDWGDDNIYECTVEEKQDNGKVYLVSCTKSGRVKEVNVVS